VFVTSFFLKSNILSRSYIVGDKLIKLTYVDKGVCFPTLYLNFFFLILYFDIISH